MKFALVGLLAITIATIPCSNASDAANCISQGLRQASSDVEKHYRFAKRLELQDFRSSPREIFRFTTPSSSLGGIRYKVDGGKPVVLLHGLSSDDRIWIHFATELQRQGRDVWVVNLREHGEGLVRSHTTTPGANSFDWIVADDMPAVMDHIYKTTNRKVSLIGYCLGGMASKLHVSGVVRLPNGRMGIDFAEKTRRASQIESLTLMATPIDPHQWPTYLRYLASGAIQLRTTLNLPVHSIHPDIQVDALRNLMRGYSSRDGLSYPQAQRGYGEVPTLVVAGTADSMAPPNKVMAEARSVNPDPKLILLKDTGHFSYVVGEKASRTLANRVNRFLEDPRSFQSTLQPVDRLNEEKNSGRISRYKDYWKTAFGQ